MQKHSQIDDAAKNVRVPERRTNARKRGIVDRGISAGQGHLICGIEYLRSREIDATIIERVLGALLTRRLATQQH